MAEYGHGQHHSLVDLNDVVILSITKQKCQLTDGLHATALDLGLEAFGTRQASEGACPIMHAPCQQLCVLLRAWFGALWACFVPGEGIVSMVVSCIFHVTS